MTRQLLAAALAGCAALGASVWMGGCSDEDGPTEPSTPRIDFTVTLPDRIPTKAALDIDVQVLEARAVEFPLTVRFEKQNTGEPFVGAGQLILFDESDRLATLLSVPILEDPRFRVTITESGDRAFSVSQTTSAIDVLDFP